MKTPSRILAPLAELALGTLVVPWARVAARIGLLEPERVGQRRGLVPSLGPSMSPPRILLHAVSLGETRAAAALARALLDRDPRVTVLLSSGNSAGLGEAARLAAVEPRLLAVGLLPWDRPSAAQRWLEALDPDLLVLVETELWPQLLAAATRRGVPIALAAARIYPRDLRRYRWIGPLTREMLGRPAWIGARSHPDADRLLALGAPGERLEVVGDPKWDLGAGRNSNGPSPPPAARAAGPFVLAASSWRPEEEQLLDAIAELGLAGVGGGMPPPTLVLAPRQPARVGSILRRCRSRGLDAARWPTAARVVVVDRFGVVPELLAGADLAVLGGSWGSRGGHSPIEAACSGVAQLCGPSTEHVEDLVAPLAEAGAVIRVDRIEAEHLAGLLRDPVALVARGEAGRRVADGLRCSERYAERLLAIARR